MSGFTDRLENYRKSLGFTKRRLADELGVKENNYNYFENGKRNPSKGFMIKLVTYSNKPEEYWLHGISEEEYVVVRNKFKCINTVVDQIVKMEWEAFDHVKNEGGRASCQDDWDTFSIMRKSQYFTWTDEMLTEYRVLQLLGKDK